MTRWVLAAAAADDLDRLVALLLEQTPEDAMPMVDLITDALNILQRHPRIGRPREAGLRESAGRMRLACAHRQAA